jgi:hypothetical protein
MKPASIVLAALVAALAANAEAQGEHEKAEAAEAAKSAMALAPAIKEAKISLAAGLKAAAAEGTPISGKFELEDGKLQLSVYTVKGDKFFEVIVDHKSGKVAKTEPITSGEDLEAAKKQAAAMAKSKRSLHEIVAKAEKANGGFRAFSVVAEIEGEGAEADVSLLKGTKVKQVEERL